MSAAVQIRIGSETGRVYVKSPYNKTFVTKSRDLNGKWIASTSEWMFDGRDEARVRALCVELYGTDGATRAALVTLRVTLGDWDGPEITLGGRTLVRRRGRDSRADLGDGVIILTGGFPGWGGSVKNPRVNPQDGTVLEVRDFPEPLARELVPDAGRGRGFQVEIISEPYSSQVAVPAAAADSDPLTQAVDDGLARINSEGAVTPTSEVIRSAFAAWVQSQGWEISEVTRVICRMQEDKS